MSSVDFRWLWKPLVMKETEPAIADQARIFKCSVPAISGLLSPFTDLSRRSQMKANYVFRPPRTTSVTGQTHFENSNRFQSDSKRFKAIQSKKLTPSLHDHPT
jgi:hypothetical protein